jgi:hypothetical protein
MSEPYPLGRRAHPLGRLVEHDERSRRFAAPELTVPAKSVMHRRWSPILDQANLHDQGIMLSEIFPGMDDLDELGSCTGNAMAGALGCAPFSDAGPAAERYGQRWAIQCYAMATARDTFAGTMPPDDTGSSGNAAAKAARELGEITSWRWAFSTGALLAALQRQPVLIGSVWTEQMFTPDDDGEVHDGGEVAGGHEWLARGYEKSTNRLLADNSWSARWGVKGSFWVHLDTWERLRKRQADVTVPHRAHGG